MNYRNVRDFFDGRPWKSCLMLATVAVLIGIAPDSVQGELIYRRWAVEHGQWWRLFSGQFTHLGWHHLILNLGGLVVIAVAGEMSERRFLLAFAALVVWTGLGIHLLTELPDYTGLSGVLYGAFLLTLLVPASRREIWAVVLISYIVGRVGYEALVGHSFTSAQAIGGPVAIQAHSLGVAGALILAAGWSGIRILQKRHSSYQAV